MFHFCVFAMNYMQDFETFTLASILEPYKKSLLYAVSGSNTKPLLTCTVPLKSSAHHQLHANSNNKWTQMGNINDAHSVSRQIQCDSRYQMSQKV